LKAARKEDEITTEEDVEAKKKRLEEERKMKEARAKAISGKKK